VTPHRRFPKTRWSLVLKASGHCREALSELLQIYEPPICSFIRSQGIQPEDARDLTQELFAEMLRRDDLAKVDPALGRFRNWLRTCAKSQLLRETAKKRAEMRGGDHIHISLDVPAIEGGRRIDAADRRLTQDQLFDRAWAQHLWNRALSRVQQRYESRGKGALFEHLEGCIGDGGTDAPDAELAVVLEISEVNVRIERHRMKNRFIEYLRCEVLATLEDPFQVDDEIRHIIEALSEKEDEPWKP
jgi:RNA polymerase sigma factor (sigma-70 family)